MLEGISRRQNLSANVASILATKPAQQRPGNNTKPEVSSRIPVKVTPAGKAVPKSNSSDQLASQDNSGTADDDDAPTTTTTQNMTSAAAPPQADGDAPAMMTSPQAGDTDEDVRRVTAEYRAVLKGVSDGVELSATIDELRLGLAGESAATAVHADDPHPAPQPASRDPSTAASDECQQKIPSQVGTLVKEFILDPNEVVDSGASDTDDTLDRDVRRILSKYGRDVSGFAAADELHASHVMTSRASPYESEDQLAQRVQQLLEQQHSEDELKRQKKAAGAVTSSSSTSTAAAAPHRSPRVAEDLNSTGGRSEDTNTCMADLGSLKDRLSQALEGGDTPRAPAAYSSDPLNDRVRQILADTTHLTSEETTTTGTAQTSKRVGSTSSPSSSLDYQNLERDLDEIQSHLESLKGGDGSSSARRDDDSSGCVSERSAELMRYVQGRVDDDTLRKARAVIAAADDNDESSFSAVTSSASSSRLEPEGQGQAVASPRGQVRSKAGKKIPISPLLTSGLVPMDIALDMLHGAAYNDDTSRDRSADTEVLLRQGNSRGDGSGLAGFSRDDDPLLNTGVSATDREVMEINGVNKSAAQDDSLTERVAKLVTSDVTGDAAGGLGSPSPYYQTSPLAGKPFTALGNMQSLIANQLNKVQARRFDTSLDAYSPVKTRHHQLPTASDRYDVSNNNNVSRGIAAAYSADIVPTTVSGSRTTGFRVAPDVIQHRHARSPVTDVTTSKSNRTPLTNTARQSMDSTR